jgi:cytochrome d ubiquinol oxidase subunit I
MKFAAIEAHWETTKPASFSILTIGDLSGKREVWSIRLPYILSFLACNNFSCEVKGVNELQAEYVNLYGPHDYIPLMVVTYWTFRFMMTVGLLMILLSAFFLWSFRKPVENARWMKWVPWVLVMPYIANSSGWILTEMGRQPWIVQGLLRVDQAVSPNLTTLDLLLSLIGFAALYSALAAAMFYLMRKYALAGPDAALEESVDINESRPDATATPVGAQD